MDSDDLLDYALGRLDGSRLLRVERRLRSDPALAERVVRLIRNLDRLLDDGRSQPALDGSPLATGTALTSARPARNPPYDSEAHG